MPPEANNPGVAPLNVRGPVGKPVPPSVIRADQNSVRVATPMKEEAPAGSIWMYALADRNVDSGFVMRWQ
ncbi:hypothetical protein PISL3812_03827 [Talaromyces islandicus]|uniref:Uncharacterized protein n=1 Tax=Talaromyces islandicus TaxID=28573 RepID=A0A0U1LUC4_TALIS|nr:hypothetical protein PISL3812_03827 [Talaromyces islandicus]